MIIRTFKGNLPFIVTYEISPNVVEGSNTVLITWNGFLEIFKPVIGVAKINVRYSFSCLVSYFCRNFEVSFMVLYGFLEISKSVIGVAKITVRFSSSCPVSPFFRNFVVSFMVLYGFPEISQTLIGDA